MDVLESFTGLAIHCVFIFELEKLSIGGKLGFRPVSSIQVPASSFQVFKNCFNDK